MLSPHYWKSIYVAKNFEVVKSNPYLGIEFQHDLKWDSHIKNKIAYKTLVRPSLEYGCMAWDPFLKKHKDMLEFTQNQALRFIYNIKGRISFTELRAEKDFESLAERRLQLRKNFFCKIVRGDVDIPIGVTIIKDCGENPGIDAPPASGTRHGMFYIPFIQSDQLFLLILA